MTEEQKLEAIANAFPPAGFIAECSPLGVGGLNVALAAQVISWSNLDHKLEECAGLEDYCIKEDKADKLLPEVAPPDQEPPGC